MAVIVVFHSALGLRPAIEAFADHLRDHGHEVHTPDLFEGRVFDDLDAGIAHRDELGIPRLIGRAQDAVRHLPDDLVYAGFSMGTAPAQLLAATRTGARGALLVQGALPTEALGIDAWPAGVPIQLHVARDDPYFGHQDAAKVLDHLPTDLVDAHEYPIDGHLFMDPDWQYHDAAATSQLLERASAWLARR